MLGSLPRETVLGGGLECGYRGTGRGGAGVFGQERVHESDEVYSGG